MRKHIHVGMDVGASAVKCIVLDTDGKILWRQYIHHDCRVMETVERVMTDLVAVYEGSEEFLCMTGQGGEDIAERFGVSFIPEIAAQTNYLSRFGRDVDAVIEIGGESAKITYLHPVVDQRVNRICAGGTGAFLDHMAKLLGTDTMGLNDLAGRGTKVYPVASRCGVFAKTDIQGLLNEGAEKADAALSLFHAVVAQVVSGLSHGRPIEGRVAFLGGPLTFLPILRKCFAEELSLDGDHAVLLPQSEYYLAFGAAVSAEKSKSADLKNVKLHMEKERADSSSSVEMVEGLFSSPQEYEDFVKRHAAAAVRRYPLSEYTGAVWMGIDAGSTTLKAVLIDKDGAILREWYGSHRGNVISRAKEILLAMYEVLPSQCRLAGVGVTGYGEGLLRKAFCLDTGEVETMAHLRAARFFCPEVTALLDIGGQDMKYCRLKDGRIDHISLNGVCSSGCGSFLESFADHLHMDIKEFARQAALAEKMPDLGRHCTVIMNSYVKKVQNRGVGLADLAAALSVSVVKNALFSVIQLESAEELGDHIVAEGGTFYNDAVLRAFERLTGKEVIRPDIAGLMGAYGMALKAKDQFGEQHVSSLPGAAEIKAFHMETENRTCPGCGNHCAVSVRRFSGGEIFVTGNRCGTGEIILTGERNKTSCPDVYQWIKDHVFKKEAPEGKCRGIVGIPAALDMWSDFPFWAGFWNSLGYRVMTSEWNEEDARQAAMTIPQRVHCHPCILAHGHLQNLIRRKPDMIWFPAHTRAWHNSFTDEKRHALYGHVLAKFMKKQIAKAKIPYLHPTLPEFGMKRLGKVLVRRLPQFSEEDIEKAVEAGYERLARYENAYKKETEKALLWIKENHKTGIVLTGRPFHGDVQIHKGVPYMAETLGAAVLSGEGLALLEKDRLPGGARSSSYLLRKACERVIREHGLELVALRSVSCGLDREAADEVEKKLKEKGKFYTVLSLDQGTNTGAVKIRLRTLLAEIEERNSFCKER